MEQATGDENSRYDLKIKKRRKLEFSIAVFLKFLIIKNLSDLELLIYLSRVAAGISNFYGFYFVVMCHRLKRLFLGGYNGACFNSGSLLAGPAPTTDSRVAFSVVVCNFWVQAKNVYRTGADQTYRIF